MGDFKCWEGRQDKGGGKGRAAFDQCCKGCNHAEVIQSCHWSVTDSGAGNTVSTADSCTDSKDPTCYIGFGYDNAECVNACELISTATEPRDICPPEPNFGSKGGDVSLQIEKLNCGGDKHLALRNIKDALMNY